MKESIKTVFKCDFCKKHLFKKHAMAKHENVCSRNPINIDACLGCSFCQEIKKEIAYDAFDGERYRTVKSFKCTKLDGVMYPHKAQKIEVNYPESFEGETVMPNECEYFEAIF